MELVAASIHRPLFALSPSQLQVFNVPDNIRRLQSNITKDGVLLGSSLNSSVAKLRVCASFTKVYVAAGNDNFGRLDAKGPIGQRDVAGELIEVVFDDLGALDLG